MLDIGRPTDTAALMLRGISRSIVTDEIHLLNMSDDDIPLLLLEERQIAEKRVCMLQCDQDEYENQNGDDGWARNWKRRLSVRMRARRKGQKKENKK